MESICKNIKDELIRKKISQNEFCEMLGINPSTMSKYLSGQRYLRGDVIAKMAKALKVDINQLYGTTEVDSTYNSCKTLLLARNGDKLTMTEKQELINIILEHE